MVEHLIEFWELMQMVSLPFWWMLGCLLVVITVLVACLLNDGKPLCPPQVVVYDSKDFYKD